MCTEVNCGVGATYFVDTFASGNAQLWWTNDRKSPWEIRDAQKWSGGEIRDGTYPDPTFDHSGDGVMAGVVIGGIAPPQFSSSPHYLATRSFDTAGGGDKVYLEYYHWLNSDSSLSMINTVEVYNGTDWVTIWSGPPSNAIIAENSWRRSVFDVTAYRNPDFAIRFGYDVLNGEAQSVSSWNVDDVLVANAPSCPTTK